MPPAYRILISFFVIIKVPLLIALTLPTSSCTEGTRKKKSQRLNANRFREVSLWGEDASDFETRSKKVGVSPNPKV